MLLRTTLLILFSLTLSNIEALDTPDKQIGIDEIETSPSDSECPDAFMQLTTDSVRSHVEEAQNYCSQKNATLPAITSAEVTSALIRERSPAMGLSPFDVFFIDLGCDLMNHRWTWIDGPVFNSSYTHFQETLTNPQMCSLDRPFFFDHDGKWVSTSRYAGDFPTLVVVCLVRPASYLEPAFTDAPTTDAIQSTVDTDISVTSNTFSSTADGTISKHMPNTSTASISTTCTGLWTELPGGLCYRLVTLAVPVNVHNAELSCRSFRGHLPSITSNEQSNLINAYLAGKGKQHSRIWIGLYCQVSVDLPSETDGYRAWIDNTPYSDEYTNFIDEDDDSKFCNISQTTTFIYNGVLQGKWQKAHADTELHVLMCTRENPQHVSTSSTPWATNSQTTDDNDILYFTVASQSTTNPTTTAVELSTTSASQLGAYSLHLLIAMASVSILNSLI